jgi:hypothetical protein
LTAPADIPAPVAAIAPHVAADGFADWPPDDLWADFEDSAPGQRESAPPDAVKVREAVAALSADGRKVTGPMLADHFGVSARTGRRYLALAAEAV